MEELDKSIEEKQNYLRQEIIVKGYSPDEFTNFLNNVKGEKAFDLNSWSLEELYSIVKQFQEVQELEKKMQNENINKKQIEIEKQNENIDKEIFLGEKEGDLWGDDTESEIKPNSSMIKCKKFEPSELIKNKEKLQIQITDVTIKKDSLFSLSYYEFNINNKLLNLDLKRKMNDFIWLKKKLIDCFPNIFIPPLPKFKIKKDEKYIQKKIYYLHSFINYIINSDMLFSSKIFQDFISLPYEEFIKSKSNLDKIPPPKNLNEVTTLDGNLNITIVPEIDKKAYAINIEMQKKNEIYSKINLTLKDIINLIYQLKQKYLQLSNIFESASQFYSKSDIIKNDKMNLNFSKLKGIFINCAEEYDKKMNYYEVYIRRFFKYMKNEMKEFNNLYKKYDNARTTFVDVTDEKEIIIDDNFKNLKKYFGFTLNMVYDEYIELNKVHNLRTREHFATLSKYI